MKKLTALVALASLFANVARADFIAPGFFSAGFVANGFFEEDAGPPTDVAVPDVVGLSLAAADTALEAEMLDTGTTTAQCSPEAANEVLAQIPIAGTIVALASTVDLTYSNGMPCGAASDRPGIRIGIGIGVTQ